MATQKPNQRTKTMPKMPLTILEQTPKTREERKMTKEEKKQEPKKLLRLMAGTATSSPVHTAPSRVDIAIPNVMLWMKKNAYESTTIRKAAKLLRHLQRQKNCNLADPESVKLCIGTKNCSNAHKENLIEAYAMVAKSLGLA